jgi:hypothetical protein
VTGTLRARALAVSIGCAPGRVYDFISDPGNLPQWSFFGSVAKSGEHWVDHTPDGPVGFRFVEASELGVLDHHVMLESGVEVHMPKRRVDQVTGLPLAVELAVA